MGRQGVRKGRQLETQVEGAGGRTARVSIAGVETNEARQHITHTAFPGKAAECPNQKLERKQQ